MKKFLAIILAAGMVIGLAACGGNQTPTTTEAPKTTEAPAEPEVVAKITVLNPVLAGLEAVKDPANTRYQAYWLKGISLGDVMDAEFWFEVDPETVVQIVAYSDQYAYAEEITAETLKAQGLCLEVPEALQNNYYEGLVYGTGIKKDQHPYHVGWIVVGPEAILLANDDGFEVNYLFEDLKMVDADSYDFVCADGYAEEIDKDDLAQVEIFFNEGRVDATSIAYPAYTLQNILYIVPHGVEAENAADVEVAKDTVYKITVANTAAAVGEYEEFVGPFGGTVQTGYLVSEILEAAELTDAVETVKAISLGESATTEIPYDQFVERYIVPVDSKDRGAYTVGRSQNYGEVTINVGCYVLDENILLYVPETATEEAGIALTEILTRLGYTDVTAINVVCSDGWSEQINVDDLEGINIFHVDDRIDTNSVAYPTYTLQDVVTIEIIK